MGSNQTEVTTVLFGGAVATILTDLLIAPWAAGRGIEMSTSLTMAIGVVITGAIAYALPASVISKVRRRTRPEAER